MEPLVSVVIPSYNRASMIERALNSLIRQTHRNWEALVVDDGSTDNTEELVKGFSVKDTRVKYFRQEKNGGACVARNRGIDESRGEFITFLDSDDEYHPRKIELQVRVFRESPVENLGVVSCGREDERDGKVYLRWIPTKRGDILQNLLRKERIGGNTSFLMVKASVIREHGIYFDPEMPAGQDWDFLVRVCQVSSFDFVPEPVVIIHHHAGERVYTNERSLVAIDKQYHKYKPLLEKNSDSHDKFVLKMAVLNFVYGKRDKAVQILEKQPVKHDIHSRMWLAYFRNFRSHNSFLGKAVLKSLKKVTGQ